jgi:hypothetical protein
MSEAKRQGWLADLTSEERPAFARHGEFAAHKQRGLAAIPKIFRGTVWRATLTRAGKEEP